LPELRGVVADIGGGKEPFLSSEEVNGITYVGIDIVALNWSRLRPARTTRSTSVTLKNRPHTCCRHSTWLSVATTWSTSAVRRWLCKVFSRY
jgi:hypothetical protein